MDIRPVLKAVACPSPAAPCFFLITPEAGSRKQGGCVQAHALYIHGVKRHSTFSAPGSSRVADIVPVWGEKWLGIALSLLASFTSACRHCSLGRRGSFSYLRLDFLIWRGRRDNSPITARPRVRQSPDSCLRLVLRTRLAAGRATRLTIPCAESIIEFRRSGHLPPKCSNFSSVKG